MSKVRLIDICQPKQWKTIPTSQLTKEGYPVYGANGKIGFYSEYNHEKETILITCRGATCGSLNISEPFSYVNGNAMCLDNLDDSVLLKYLYYNLCGYNFSKVISGTAQPQITGEGLSKVVLNIHSANEQKIIVDLIEKLEKILISQDLYYQKLDELIKSRFVEMFGDPKINIYCFEKKNLKESCDIITGNTPSRANAEYYGNHIEWIKTDNILTNQLYPSQADEFLSVDGMNVGRCVDKGSILMSCIAGSLSSIGRVCITDRKVAFNQQINALVPKDYNVIFLYVLLLLSKDYLLEGINMALKGILSKSGLGNKQLIIPPTDLQNQFADFVTKVEQQKSTVQKSIDKLETLKKSLMQKYFG